MYLKQLPSDPAPGIHILNLGWSEDLNHFCSSFCPFSSSCVYLLSLKFTTSSSWMLIVTRTCYICNKYTHICVQSHTHSHTTYWGRFMYRHIFRTGHLGLDNLWRGLSMKKTDSPSLSSHWLQPFIYEREIFFHPHWHVVVVWITIAPIGS